MTHEQYLIAALLVACLAWLATAWAWQRAKRRVTVRVALDKSPFFDDAMANCDPPEYTNDTLFLHTAELLNKRTEALQAIATATATGKSGTARKINRMAREGLE